MDPRRGRGRGVGRGRGGGGRPTDTPPNAQQQPPPATGSAQRVVLQHDIFASAGPAPVSAASAGRAAAPGSGDFFAKPTRAPAAGRFRPKNVRRDEAARDLLARQEAEKEDAKRIAEDRQRTRGRFRSRRSRGNTMGRGSFRRGSAAPGSFDWKGKKAGTGGHFLEHDPDAPEYQRPRINADRFDRRDEIEDDPEASASWPMGIDRTEHKEVEFTVATTAELEAQEHDAGEGTARDVIAKAQTQTRSEQTAADNKVWHAAPKNLATIKSETGEPTIIDFDAEMKHPSPPPPPQPDAAVKEEEKPKPVAAAAPETEEDLMLENLRLLTQELGLSATQEADGSEGVPTVSNKDGRLYLFQLPPILPPLRIVPNSGKPGAVTIKPDPETLEASSSAQNATDPVLAQLARNPNNRGGLVGRLNVRKSGKVELDWGGTPLELDAAVDMNFVTTAVIVEEGDDKNPHGDGALGGESIGMGRIMGRFSAAPVWPDEEDWIVAPEELVVDEDLAMSWPGGVEY